MSLTGKVAVITGASSGIGHATAKALAAQGATVVVTGRREDRLVAVAKEIVQDGGIADTCTCDVTDEDQATAMIKDVVDRHGRIDVLVNNAGVMLLSRIERGLTDEWRQMTDVNLHGVLFPTHAVLPVMKAQGSGAIVNISSTAARRSRPLGGVYAATKAAVTALSESIRLEVLKDGIGVTVIIPGAVDTELATHITDKEAQGGIAALKQNMEFLQPEDVAAAVVYTVGQPSRVNVSELVIRPQMQEF
ncbi:SDR family oxidoreductase [Actinomadura soli]|uniref:SDR family oxidoreductase n=1 Tax=Actinomadura soli TaxID=2508997 RepID=A0A5C4JG95_9ACTN|nr:SDR family oxidoreductase [Actinomadura soli]TMR04937.1 SDR family oxidoreductase [Actinomadura soli]